MYEQSIPIVWWQLKNFKKSTYIASPWALLFSWDAESYLYWPIDISKTGFLHHVFSILEIAPTSQALQPKNPLFVSPSGYVSIHWLLVIVIVKIVFGYIFYSPFQFPLLTSLFNYGSSLPCGILTPGVATTTKSLLYIVMKFIFLNTKSS